MLTFKQGDALTISCPGKRNGLAEFTDETDVQGQCKNKAIQVDGEAVRADQLVCDQLAESYVQATGTKCGNSSKNGEIFDVGFQVSWLKKKKKDRGV